MEKSGLPKSSYPQMPAEMAGVGPEANYSGYTAQAAPAPPSYDQATNPAPYPRVQVLPTTATDGANQPAQYATAAATAPTNGGYHSTTYGAAQMGGTGFGGHAVPPPQHMYMPHATAATQPMVQQPVVIIQQQAVLPLGPEPTYITCPACHVTKLTRIDYEPSSRTHLMAALLCIVGLWCCVCLPYCAESCMSTNHYCGNCNKFLGTYNGGGF